MSKQTLAHIQLLSNKKCYKMLEISRNSCQLQFFTFFHDFGLKWKLLAYNVR